MELIEFFFKSKQKFILNTDSGYFQKASIEGGLQLCSNKKKARKFPSYVEAKATGDRWLRKPFYVERLGPLKTKTRTGEET